MMTKAERSEKKREKCKKIKTVFFISVREVVVKFVISNLE